GHPARVEGDHLARRGAEPGRPIPGRARLRTGAPRARRRERSPRRGERAQPLIDRPITAYPQTSRASGEMPHQVRDVGAALYAFSSRNWHTRGDTRVRAVYLSGPISRASVIVIS